ncbi:MULTISPECIES: penicillin-binding protein 2 [Parabacteroides]|uniref:Penicillin-binding protein 2 n=1 Tax=Parabacteroides gordonii MS-1 = DSM 23371 TaxID=1203610 RepID=A0A0F5JDI7_9BACT|nr:MULTISPECIES: penicillin-binding protein 2 [Parabacteroides]KKB52759.1 penicillin-binding protein 2 [Parabacteroides sp. HGS0025]KKB55839.1 penicillin-binding protein 2 [Parabacteroides gordonii MS-1 = DSM 23371]MCA5581379.1 penicillin-binding protein 2 [Parabacteroides gordonii]MCD8135418.1 penicillin-binding protein 2 [Parabacteroides gordonii]RGP18352.1 penicillin-binding protein 2 [Parabacteroides gordonii]
METNAKYTLENRRYVIIGAVVLLVLIFIARLFYLQVVENDYKAWADSNAFLKKTLYPSRGIIYDRNGKLLVYNQPAYDVMLIMREVQPFDTLDFCKILSISREQFDKRIADIKNRRLNPGYSSYVPQVFMNHLSAQECGVLQEKLYKFPGFYIQNRTIRQYEYPNAAHVLGNIGEVNRKDIQSDDYYVQGDNSGRSGVERSYEKELRGVKGVEILLRDVHGRIKGKYDEGNSDVAPVSGKNLTLSIDMDLQAYGEKLMRNKVGSIVMIEPATGEVLCLVSSPNYDPGLLVGRQRGKNHHLLSEDPQKPLIDRAITGFYPPGSTFKPTQGLIFLQEGVITPETMYTCAHGYTYRGGKPACHGHPSPLSLVPALATSCNSYFCWGLHDMLDSRRRYPSVQEAFEIWKNHLVSMGYGYPLGIDLPGEKRGYIPNSKVYDKVYGGRWNSSTVISIAIGQGEVSATPLQICNLAATIANRGYFITPHVVKEVQDTPLDTLYTNKRYPTIDSKYYDIVAEGMRNAVLGGTCWRAAIPGIEVCGKTGTAENPHGKDHSAFIGFAPYKDPKVAICVYVQNGGFGAAFGVPIGKLMMELYLKGEIAPEDKVLEEQISNTVVDSDRIYSLVDRGL